MGVAFGFDVRSLLTSFVVGLLICFLALKKFRERNYPPGPKGLPLVGFMYSLRKDPHKVLSDLGKKYGDIFSFSIGPVLHIGITDFHIAKELLTHPLTLARPPKAFDFMMGKGGFSSRNGVEWQEQRRFSFFTMRNLGLGKGLWDSMIQISADDFVEKIQSWKGKPTDIEEPLMFSQVSNNVALLIGRHFDKEKEADKIKTIKSTTAIIMPYLSSTGVTVAMPWIAKFMETLRLGGYHNFIQNLRSFENILRKEVEDRMKSSESLMRDDFIGCYFQEMEKKEKEGKPHYFTLENLLGNLLILFLGGSSATMAGTSWLLLLMANHQDVQNKIHEEIDKVFGRDGVLQYDERNKLPFTMATVQEMNRIIAISSLFPPRYALETFKFNGYTIPKGCRIVVNIWSIMRDPRYFKDPEKFLPERHLTDNGEKVLKLDGYAPFSFGKRNCPGEGVAIMTIFLYFVRIMQKFRVTVPPGATVDMEPIFGGTVQPKPQEICFTER